MTTRECDECGRVGVVIRSGDRWICQSHEPSRIIMMRGIDGHGICRDCGRERKDLVDGICPDAAARHCMRLAGITA